jgi:hypothetical protein
MDQPGWRVSNGFLLDEAHGAERTGHAPTKSCSLEQVIVFLVCVTPR